jgi:hypothetical protein
LDASIWKDIPTTGQVYHVDKDSFGMFLNYEDFRVTFLNDSNSPDTIGDDDNDNDNDNNNYSPDFVGDV